MNFRTLFLWLVVASSAACSVASASVSVERRTYQIDVDGKPSGFHRMVIQEDESGQLVMTSEAEVHVQKWIIHYNYRYRGAESWRGGRLTGLQAQSSENNRPSTVRLVEKEQVLQVNVDGKVTEVPKDVWTDTYWHLPERFKGCRTITLLECDSGERFTCSLKLVGQEAVNCGGHIQSCSHYRLGGDRVSDIWFDCGGKLVKESHIDDGHLAVIQLKQSQIAQK